MSRTAKLLSRAIFFFAVVISEGRADVVVPEEAKTEQPFEYIVESKGEIGVENNFTIEVINLIGTVTVESSQGSNVEWQTVVHSVAKDEKRAKELGEKLKIKIDEEQTPKKIAITALYPISEHSIYYYPAKENGAKESRKKREKERGAFKYKTKLAYQDKDVTVMTEPSLAAIYLFADITLKVPQGGKVVVKNYVGKMKIHDFVGELDVESMSAPIHLIKGQGKLFFSTANGSVDVQEYDGEINGASGDAKLTCSSCTGCVQLNTGSGQIVFDDSNFELVHAKSGSGAISLKRSTGDLLLTTGSGRIQAEDFKAKKFVKIETGSGDIRLKGDFSLLEKLLVQTGSGDISFVSTPFPKIFFDVRSASGEVSVKVPTMRSKPAYYNIFMGSIDQTLDETKENEATAIIRSGSGDIRLGTLRKAKSTSKEK